MATLARNDIKLQRIIDEPHHCRQAVMMARMRAAVVAQQRMSQREPDANY
jgi:hypothetical protein